MKGKDLVLFNFIAPKATFEAYKEYKDCGFNAVVIDFNPTNLENILSFCDELDIDAYPMARGILEDGKDGWKNFPEPDDPIDYASHKSFKGSFLQDEPTIESWEKLKQRGAYLQKKYPDATGLINVYCGYSDPALADQYPADELGRVYERARATLYNYGDEILDGLNGRKILCFDYYPLDAKDGVNTLRYDYLWTYDTCAHYAKKKGYELWAYIQSAGISNEEYLWHRNLTSVEDYRFQCLVALAYGANGIGAFTYTSYSGFKGCHAIVDENGPTDTYYFVQQAHKDVKALYEEMSGYEYEGTGFELGKTPHDYAVSTTEQMKFRKTSYDKITVESQYAVVVGEFSNGEKRGYLIVNYIEPSNALVNDIKITAKNGEKMSVYDLGKRYEIKSGETVRVATGNGIFVEI